MHRSRLSSFVIDCKTDEVAEAAEFWSAALGRKIKPTLVGDGGADRTAVLRHQSAARAAGRQRQRVAPRRGVRGLATAGLAR